MQQQDTLDQSTQHAEPVVQTAIDISQIFVDAMRHHHAGDLIEAEQLYQKVLAVDPDHAGALYGFGLHCTVQGRMPEAIVAYRHAIVVRPDFVDAYVNLGTAMLGIGRHEDAEALYRQALAINPDNAVALGNLGKALQDLGRTHEAIVAYRAGIDRQPSNAAIHVNFGAALLDLKAWEDAATITRQAIALEATNAMAYANLGTALLHLGRYREALEACRAAIALKPQGVAIHASLGGAMLELGAWQEAATLCRHAIALDPAHANAHFNLSHALKAQNQLEDAALAARHAIALQPGSAEYHFHLAHILLLMGDLEAGWTEYDWRLKLADFSWIGDVLSGLSQPTWAGEDIHDKTILVLTEQGLGDIIQFARYLPLLARMASRVIVAAHPPTQRLLRTIEGVTVVSIEDLQRQDFDVVCPLLSLPRAFRTRIDNIPAAVPYLRADPAEQARWDQRIGGNQLRVGVVWAGNPVTHRDRFRSPGRHSVAPLFSVPGVDFIILQVGTGRQDVDAAPLPPHVQDLGAEVADLADTAAIMAGLDLMISSCTGPLHLAGALAVPTWAMIPFAPHFPWLLGHTDTRWYPGMKLYRQEKPGQDWSHVVTRIAADLAILARVKTGRSAAYLQASGSEQKPEPTSPIGLATYDESPASDGKPGSQQEVLNVTISGFNELAQCRSGPMLYNRNDIYIGASLRKYGEFSAGETDLFRIIIQPGMTVLDIGANIGVHTVDLSHMTGPAGVVHAFEPQRLMFQLLCANVALNSCTNVFTHHAAVGATGGSLLVPSLDPDGHHNYGGLSLPGAHQGEVVPVVTIDSLMLTACHAIKLDVEGMETEALDGAVMTIGRSRPILYVENDRQDRSAALISLLQSYGYRLYWHLPPIYSANNFRHDPENIFGNTISANMLCLPAEWQQEALTGLRAVTGPDDHWYNA